jgi:FAD/FMN-containing dehydrogenase
MEATKRVVGARSHPAELNDVHSGLNATCVSRKVEAYTLDDVVRTVQRARTEVRSMAIAGGRHAMGGQQFLSGGTLLDMRGMNRVRRFDEERGLLEVEAGIQWPGVLRAYLGRPSGMRCSWGIRQKQTGADRLTIGGAVKRTCERVPAVLPAVRKFQNSGGQGNCPPNSMDRVCHSDPRRY